MYNLFKTTSQQYSNNILGLYNSSRTDENEAIPNVERIRNSVDKFIDINTDNVNLQNNIDLCLDDTLFVHLRSGDKGIVEDEFIDNIISIYKNNNFQKIVILCGIHQNHERSHHFPSLEDSINNLNYSLQKLKTFIPNIIIDTNEPDFHLCVMRKSKNLLVHKGGFSMLGALLFTGNNLFITHIFNPYQTNNTQFFEFISKEKLRIHTR
jgi:hypothetical protein